jgi:hypothetical protein
VGPLPKWVPFEEAEETLTPPPISPGRGAAVCTGPLLENGKKLQVVSFHFSLSMLDCSNLRNTRWQEWQAKLFINCEFSMIFLALIPLVNYYS